MKAIILAAGRGSRLHPYTENHPKCLTVLGDKTLIDWQVRTLSSCGVSDIIIVTGYMNEMLKITGTNQIYNPKWETTNMVESLFCAENNFGNDVLVSYGDIIYERQVLESLLKSSADISVALNSQWYKLWKIRFNDPLSDAETLKLGPDNQIMEIGNVPSSIHEIESQYMGMMRFRGAGIQAIKTARQRMFADHRPWKEKRPAAKAYMTDLLTELIDSGQKVHGVENSGGWLEIDTVDDYKKISALFETGNIKEFFDPSL